MALSNFIPTIWEARLLKALEKAHVYGQAGVINRDYEGQIRDVGDSVKINSIGDITISNYTRNTNMSAPQSLNDAGQLLQITEGKSFNFYVDDIDKVQALGDIVNEAMTRAAYGLRDVMDKFLAAKWSEAATGNFIGTNASPKTDLATAGVPYNYLLQMGTVLDEADIPSEGRWVIVPPWYKELLLKDTRIINPGTPQAEDRLTNAVVARLAGFTILQSNNVVNTSNDNYKIMFGHSIAWSMAEQIVKVEAYRPELRFGDAVKGLHVYGAKVVRPAALGVLHADRP
jgi:hypothetical protein